MSDREALLRSILAQPAEDTTRLAYADFLDEQGEGERAELIRVQCQLARVGPPHKRTSYPDEATPMRALGEKQYEFGAHESDGFAVGDRIDLLRHREPKPSKWVYGLRVYKIVPRARAYERDEVDVYARLDAESGPWKGADLKARERAILNRLCHFSKVLRGWSVHGDLFANTLGVEDPDGYKMSIALFDAPANGRACLNFSFSRGNVKVTGDMRLYFDRGFACEWWCPLLDFRDHAAFMFATHPITAVRFTTHEPQAYMNETEPDVWRTLPASWSDFRRHGELPGWLPRELCPIGGFDSKGAATEAVSKKAAAYGRSLADLPPLLPESGAP